ncbi:MAG TPA: MmcQ/YjbR family DNA-binding protein [Longimicrobiales bacterium]
MEDGTSYHTPGLRVRGKLIARLHEDGDDFILRMERDTRALLLRVRPEVFYITDHYLPYDWVRVRLAAVGEAELRDVFADAWRSQAPKRLIAEYARAQAGNPALPTT